jgi:hypothetical protein
MYSIENTDGVRIAHAAYNAQTGTTYTIQASDAGKIITFDHAASIAVTLPDTLDTNFQCTLIQIGAGIVTVTPDTDTINDAGDPISTSTIWNAIYLSQHLATEWLALVGEGGYALQGKQTMFVPAAAMTPTTSNGCAALASTETTAGRPDIISLDFDTAADEHAQFQVAFPKSWNLGTVSYQAYWTSTATDTDTVEWALQGVAASDGDTIDVAYGTAIAVNDAAQSTAEDQYVTAESAALTIAGTPTAGNMCYFRGFRDVSEDTMEEDAQLIGIKFFYTTNAGNDA